MYLLTKKEGEIESGVYASVDDDGTAIVQFFVSKDDAIMYNTLLEALDQNICVTEIDDDLSIVHRNSSNYWLLWDTLR